jgi:hypothetical protein
VTQNVASRVPSEDAEAASKNRLSFVYVATSYSELACIVVCGLHNNIISTNTSTKSNLATSVHRNVCYAELSQIRQEPAKDSVSFRAFLDLPVQLATPELEDND